MLPCQVSLPSPPNRMYKFPSVQLSGLPLAILPSIASNMFGSCTLCSSHIPRNWKTCRPSPCTRLSRAPRVARYATDYYADSVARLIFRCVHHSQFPGSQTQGNPRFFSHPDALDLGGPFRLFIQILGVRLLGGYKHVCPLHAYPGESRCHHLSYPLVGYAA